jgi:poly(3-hydroxybutyrate) depolymerase
MRCVFAVALLTVGACRAPASVPTTSPGCGAPGLAFAGAHEVTIAGKPRAFTVQLPDGYDPARTYPVIFGLHGAGDDGPSFATYFPLAEPWKNDAIFVYPSALFYPVDGRTTWRFNTDENLAFFDAMVAEVQANLCVDSARIFASGFSSGGFLSNTLGCRRGDVVRAIVPVAGGDRDFSDVEGNDLCVGHVAAMVISSPLDTSDPTGGPPGISHHQRGLRARDYFRARNGCADVADPVAPEGCVRYQGCMPGAEVFYCEHQQGHAWPAPLHAAASDFLSHQK